MSKIGSISILLFTLLGSTSVFAQGMWGTGMYPAQQGCGFNPTMTEEIRGIKAEQDEIKESLKDIKEDIRRARTRKKTAERALADVKTRFQKHGLGGGAYNIIDRHISSGRSCDSYATEECPASRPRRGGKPLSENDLKLDPIDALLALNGIGESAPVRNVASTKVPPGKPPKDVEDAEQDYDVVAPPKVQPQQPPPQQRAPNQEDGASVPDGQGEADCGPSRSSTSPFSPAVWGQACQGSSVSGSFICRQGIDQGPNFSDRMCESLLRDWLDKKKDADEADAKLGELESELARLNIEKTDKQSEYKEAVKESREEYRRTLTEGGCIECMLQGNSYYQQQRKPNWLEVGGNLLLGIGSMYFGQQQQRYISDNNAKLGFPSQSYPAIGYGYPYFMNALYGAVGGGMSGGAFGCGGGMGGAGGGGAFGYPNGMMGGPMGGGMFNGGFGPGALGYGPGGYMMGGGMMMPGGGGYMMPGYMMPGYMMSGGMMMPGGGMMMPGGGYMMPGYMMNGMMGMMSPGMMPGAMMPGAMMPGYMMNGYMNGMAPGMMMSGGMMMPGGGYMMPGMGYMMPGSMVGGGIGMMGNGMMPGYMMSGSSMMPGYMMGGMTGMMMPGAMGGGMSGMMMPGYMMSGMVPGSMMSMMPGAMGGGMMGGLDPMAMQMQQMQMQLQMQQMQTMQQMQQRRMENYMAQSRVVSGLTMELNTLYSRLQQAQMSMYSGGSFGFDLGVSAYGNIGPYGTSALPVIQGGVNTVPGGIGAPTFR